MTTLDGYPAGVEVTSQDVRDALARRRLGHGRGSRQKFEQDEVTILGGLRHGRTLGSPIAVEIGNTEWPKWHAVMSPDPVPREDLLVDAGTGDEREIARNKALTRPRPGHADLAGMAKYGFDDARPVLERASARETAARVVAGTFAARLLEQTAGVHLVSHPPGRGPPALLRRGDLGGDGRGGRRRQEGRRHPGRRGRGPRLRRPGGPRRPHPVGP
jgi:chorismate synthase